MVSNPAPSPGSISPTVSAMLGELPNYIAWALTDNQNSLPRNPHLTTQLQAKIAMLGSPTLANDITSGRRWSEGSVTSMNGRTVPIAALFPLESMRADASQDVRAIERALPVLEGFMAAPIAASAIRIWYGFIIGNRGGGGTIHTEDRATYEARTGPDRLPHEAILDHELSHTYIGHEGLNQFLELYVYNVVQTGSPDVRAWVFDREYQAWRASNEGIHALLDVYQLIGRERMAGAYGAVTPLRPPYGQPLSAECRQVFVEHAPPEVRAQVAEKMARVTY